MMRSGNNVIIKKEKVPRKITTWTENLLAQKSAKCEICHIIHKTKIKKDVYWFIRKNRDAWNKDDMISLHYVPGGAGSAMSPPYYGRSE